MRTFRTVVLSAFTGGLAGGVAALGLYRALTRSSAVQPKTAPQNQEIAQADGLTIPRYHRKPEELSPTLAEKLQKGGGLSTFNPKQLGQYTEDVMRELLRPDLTDIERERVVQFVKGMVNNATHYDGFRSSKLEFEREMRKRRPFGDLGINDSTNNDDDDEHEGENDDDGSKNAL